MNIESDATAHITSMLMPNGQGGAASAGYVMEFHDAKTGEQCMVLTTYSVVLTPDVLGATPY